MAMTERPTKPNTHRILYPLTERPPNLEIATSSFTGESTPPKLRMGLEFTVPVAWLNMAQRERDKEGRGRGNRWQSIGCVDGDRSHRLMRVLNLQKAPPGWSPERYSWFMIAQ